MVRTLTTALSLAGPTATALLVSMGCEGSSPATTSVGGDSSTGAGEGTTSGDTTTAASDGPATTDSGATETSADGTSTGDTPGTSTDADTGSDDTGTSNEFEVLVNSRGTNAIFRYDQDGTFLGEFIASGAGGLASPEDVLFHPDGTILVSGFGNAAIKQYDARGTYLGDFSSGYTLASPSKMSIGPDDLVYITQWGDAQNEIVRFDLGGRFVDEFTSVGAPKGLGHFWDARGRFYVSLFGDANDGTIHRFDPMGNDLGTFIDSAVLQGPTDIWQDARGDVLVEDWIAGTVLRYSETGEYIGTFITGMTSPEGIAFTPEGDLLIGDWGQDVVHRFDAEGNDLGDFASGDGLSDPNGVVIWMLEGTSEGR